MKLCFNGPQNLHTERWVTYFANHGHEVHLVIDEPVSYEGVNVHCLHLELSKNPLYFLRKLLGLKRVIKEIQPDLLHSHYITGEGYIGAMTGFHPFVSTIWGTDIYVRPKKGIDEKLFTRFVMKRSDLITADSQDQIGAAVELGAAQDKCRLVQWGVDLNTFRPRVASDVRSRLAIGDGPVVISQRKFQPLYNIDIIVQSFSNVLKVLPNAHLVLTGDGFDEIKVRDQVSRLRIDANVHFTGYLAYGDLALYLSVADISISIPSWDGTAMAILEAMACGVPLIVSDLASNREWIEDGKNGYIVQPRDHERLTVKMIELLKDRTTRERFSSQNVGIVRERADHEKHMARMETYYRELCGR
ncbi:MAG: glycosyltransferase [Gemmatimonadota bacterium]|nr:glycosyltransferase [Gemmatimonadota bacterium]